MNITILEILNRDAKAWPAHDGDRPAQRRSIRAALATIRQAVASPGGHVWIAPHGVSVHYTREGYGHCSLQSYTLPTSGTALAAMAAGVPWIDTRDVDNTMAIINAPMIAVDGRIDPEPWSWISCVPREAVFKRLRAIGARTGRHGVGSLERGSETRRSARLG